MPEQKSDLGTITSQPLSAVAFVHDYVEFHFDGKILRAFSAPTLSTKDAAFTFPQLGSRDAFCSTIGRTATQVDIREGDRIEILFDNGAVLSVPLSLDVRQGPEAAHFVPGYNQPIEVW